MAGKTRKVIEVLLTAKDKTASGFRTFNRSMVTARTRVNDFVLSLRGLAVGLGAGAIGQYFVNIAIGADKLNASLRTVTGSSEDAADALEQIKAFAGETSLTVNEVAEAFITLKSRGLDPSMDTMRAYGNVALGLGKTLDQFIEAVADASVGEFERLKEFGIKSKKQGDIITFVFDGMKTNVENNAKAIEAYLRNLGETKFAGGLENDAKTLGGSFRRLHGAIGQVAESLWGASGLGTVMPLIINGFTALIKKMAGATTEAEKLEKKISEVKEQLQSIGEYDINSPILGLFEKAFDFSRGRSSGDKLVKDLEELEKKLADIKEGKRSRAAERQREADAKLHNEKLEEIQKKSLSVLKAALKAKEQEFERHAGALEDARDRQTDLMRDIAGATEEFEDYGSEQEVPDRFDIVEATSAVWNSINAGDLSGARANLQKLIDMFRAYQEAGKASRADVVTMTGQLEALGDAIGHAAGAGLDEMAEKSAAAAKSLKTEIQKKPVSVNVEASKNSGDKVIKEVQKQVDAETHVNPIIVPVGIGLAWGGEIPGAATPGNAHPGADIESESNKRGFRL